jgi:hypothetical protein
MKKKKIYKEPKKSTGRDGGQTVNNVIKHLKKQFQVQEQ